MEQSLACPHCGQIVLNQPALAGHIVQCPACNRPFQLPMFAVAVQSSASTPTPNGAKSATYWPASKAPNARKQNQLRTAIKIALVATFFGAAVIPPLFNLSNRRDAVPTEPTIAELQKTAWKLIDRQESRLGSTEVIAGVTLREPRRIVFDPSEFSISRIDAASYSVQGHYWQTEYYSSDPRYNPPVAGGSPRKIKHDFKATIHRQGDAWQLRDFEAEMVEDNFGKKYRKS